MTQRTTERLLAGRSTSAARHCYSVLTTGRTLRSMTERPGPLHPGPGRSVSLRGAQRALRGSVLSGPHSVRIARRGQPRTRAERTSWTAAGAGGSTPRQ